MVGKNPVVLPGAHVINPISWTRSEKLAPAEDNLARFDMGPDGLMIFQKPMPMPASIKPKEC